MPKQITDSLLAGVGRTDITPPGNCCLEGFAGRDHVAEGIHDPLYATALALSTPQGDAVIVSMDILDIPDSTVDMLWEKIRGRFSLEPRQILFNASHTHAGPMTWPRIDQKHCPDRNMCFPDTEYMKRLVENIVAAVEKALENSKPARASWGIGETRIGICRRAQDTSTYRGPASGYLGIYANYPNPLKEVDRTCPVIQFTDENGSPLALVFGASCHPTTMSHDNYLVSAEYPGAARKILEERIGAPAMFLQGIAGDVKPRRVAMEKSFRSGTLEDVEAVGVELAEDVLRTMKHGLKPLDIRLRSALRRFPVPLAAGWDEKIFRNYLESNQPLHRRIWAEWWLDKISAGESIPREIPMALSILELSEDLRFACLAGEILTGIGLKVKHRFPSGVTLPLGYSNGRSGYIPDSDVLREGGYEVIESIFFTPWLPAPWREDIDDTILGAFDALQASLED
ncbi:MAG: neutral/alkaline non-lysosomal ceramidase N-terminal domain-containing protein [Candidatus Latescibacter sp.]|nr:neutral/alkaline non-lysosomal ceramidase N-terminal domain-containing protein [Candidatus Latescibacter sp.]